MTLQTILYFLSILLTCAFIGFLAFYAWRRPALPRIRTFGALAVFRRYGLLKHSPPQEPVSRLTNFEPHEKRSLAILVFIFILFTSCITAAAYLTYRNYEKQFRSQVEHQLSAITDLKVSGLENWRDERMGDAKAIYNNPAFAALAQRCLENPEDIQSREQLQAWLDSVRNAYDYDRVFLLDTEGVEQISSPTTPEAVATFLTDEADAIFKTQQVVFLDFHRDTPAGPIHLAILVPVYAEQESNRLLGLLVLRIDPETYLYPNIQRWPVPSTTAETLIVRREGEEVLYLNKLRYRPDVALNMRFSLEETQLPAVKAVLGYDGIVEGLDYRGVPVIANVSAVPNSPWFIISKMDTAEVYAPLKARAWQTTLFFGMLVLVAGAGLTLVWRQQRIHYYRSQIATVAALRASEEKFRLAFDTSPDSIAITRLADGMFVSVNKGFEQITGYTREQVVGKSSLEINIWKDPEDRRKVVEGLQAWGEVRNYEAPFLTRAGEIVGLMSATIIELNGVPHILNITRDITERKQAEQQLATYTEKLEEMVDARTSELKNAQEQLVRHERLVTLGQLAGSIGHELRNPLGVISNAVYFLKAQPDATDTVREYLDIIEKETHTSDKIITDLLDFTRVKSVDREPASVSELIRQTLERYPVPPSVEVTLKIAARLPQVYADPHHIIQVLGNLTVNACQAMENVGKLIISAAAQGDMIRITVRDSGVGIPPENMSKLFEPLFTTKTKGIGLGLAVSRKLAEANGGRIEVQSEPGQGSTFTLYLPFFQEVK